jgi:hypothetical protein
VFPGLAFREALAGHYWRLDAPTEVLSIAATVEAHAPDLAELARDRAFLVKGSIDVERLASGTPIEGTLAFRFAHRGRLHYRLAFEGDDGRRYELGGQKEWSPLAPIDSLGVLAASLYDAKNEEIARATLRPSAPGGAWSVLKSLRLSSLL